MISLDFHEPCLHDTCCASSECHIWNIQYKCLYFRPPELSAAELRCSFAVCEVFLQTLWVWPLLRCSFPPRLAHVTLLGSDRNYTSSAARPHTAENTLSVKHKNLNSHPGSERTSSWTSRRTWVQQCVWFILTRGKATRSSALIVLTESLGIRKSGGKKYRSNVLHQTNESSWS